MNARTAGPSSRLTAEVLRGPALADLGMRVIAGQTGFQRPISWGRIQRPGLALAGFLPFIKPGRIQIVGESELHYFATMPPELRQERVAAICALPVAAFVVTKGQRVPEEIARECERHNVPLLVSDQTTSVVIQSITRVLEDELAPATTVHGVLVDVYGMGVLLLGESGIGKSECALDLIQRGHRLVADDVVEIRKYPNGSLVGRAAEMFRRSAPPSPSSWSSSWSAGTRPRNTTGSDWTAKPTRSSIVPAPSCASRSLRGATSPC
jgi:HPr kinase/phosphorylase